MTKAQEAERQEAIEKLRGWLKPGDTVYTILRHVSRSGMQREIGVVLLSQTDGRLVDLHPNYLVAKVIGARMNRHGDGIVVGGCGMDMGFWIVYHLGHALWPEGFSCVGEGCPSSDHSNGDRDYSPHQHRDGGYALQPRWL